MGEEGQGCGLAEVLPACACMYVCMCETDGHTKCSCTYT